MPFPYGFCLTSFGIEHKKQMVEMIGKDKEIQLHQCNRNFNIINFVMGLGLFCKVIETQWLVDQVIKMATEMHKLYLED